MARHVVSPVLAGLLLLTGALNAAAADDVVRARLRASATEAVVEATIAEGWHVNAHEPRDDFLIPTTVELTLPAGVKAGAVQYPKPVERTLSFSEGKAMLLYEGTVRFPAALEGAAGGAAPVRAKFRFQACNDTTCLPPKTLELEAERPAPAGAGAAVPGGNEVADFVARWGWGATFVWVAVLGLALNLTPCVYPLISVTVAFFGGRTGTDSGRAFRHALLFALGICLSFSALGVVAALTGSLFGAALQRPAVLIGIAGLMAALALSNFGLYQIRMPTGVLQWAGRAGEGALGALFMGLTMGVVGAPCIGPIVAALLLYVGAQQSVALGFALFFTLGLGLGLPYVGLALVAGRLRRLPRGGAWLGWMEWLFGFLLLGMALHFVTPLLDERTVRFVWAILLAAGGLVLGFVGAHGVPVMRWGRRVAGVVVAVIGVSGLFAAEAEAPIAWTPFSDAALTSAVSAGRPALIDFQATWCLPCREMERTTFRDPEVVRAARDFATLMADVTAQDERSDALMERWGVAGVPTYLLLGPDGQERRRFVGFVPVERLLDAMRDVVGPERG